MSNNEFKIETFNFDGALPKPYQTIIVVYDSASGPNRISMASGHFAGGVFRFHDSEIDSFFETERPKLHAWFSPPEEALIIEADIIAQDILSKGEDGED